MSQTFFDANGRRLQCGPKLGTGGEAHVYQCAGDSSVVLKIYHQPPRAEHQAKLRAMGMLASPSLLSIAAWPLSTLHRSSSDKTVVGIAMRNVRNASEIHELYSPIIRKTRFPKANWSFLVRTAANCARAFEELHGRGVVIGDVNQKNVLVNNKAVVTLLDCDSFQFEQAGKIFPCRVGVPEFTPPELHGLRLETVTRSAHHDNFGLAILIFHLLFMGRHPFVGRYLGSDDMPPDKAIREGRFAYHPNAESFAMRKPPNAPALALVTRDVASCFIHAFAAPTANSFSRPTAETWVRALEGMAGQLNQCRRNPSHIYVRSNSICPWCDLSHKTGADYFIAVGMGDLTARSRKIDIQAIWAQISAVQSPDTPSQIAYPSPPPQITTPPTLPLSDADALAQLLPRVTIASAAIGILFVWLPVVSFPATGVGIGLWTWFFGLWFFSSRRRILREKQKVLDTLAVENKSLIKERETSITRLKDRFETRRRELRQLYEEFSTLDAQKAAEVTDLSANAKDRQLGQFLRSKLIHNAGISGLGQTRLSALSSYGIDSAFDVLSRSLLDVPGIGPHYSSKLYSWAHRAKDSFRFDSKCGVPKSDLDAIEAKFAQKRIRIESALNHGLYSLRTLSSDGNSVRRDYDLKLADVRARIQAAEADLEATESSGNPWTKEAQLATGLIGFCVLLVFSIAHASDWYVRQVPISVRTEPLLPVSEDIIQQTVKRPDLESWRPTAPNPSQNRSEISTGRSESKRALPELNTPDEPRDARPFASRNTPSRDPPSRPVIESPPPLLQHIEAAEPSTPLRPHPRPAEFYQGIELLRKQEWADADQIFARVAAAVPNDAAVLYMQAIARIGAGRNDDARQLVRSGVRLEKIVPLTGWGLLAEKVQGRVRASFEEMKKLESP